MARQQKTNVLEGSIVGHVLRMLGPFSIAVIALISTGIVDTIYLGRLTDEARPDLAHMALAALGIAFRLLFLEIAPILALGQGRCRQFRVPLARGT